MSTSFDVAAESHPIVRERSTQEDVQTSESDGSESESQYSKGVSAPPPAQPSSNHTVNMPSVGSLLTWAQSFWPAGTPSARPEAIPDAVTPSASGARNEAADTSRKTPMSPSWQPRGTPHKPVGGPKPVHKPKPSKPPKGNGGGGCVIM